ncbi:hypothetical protein BDZ97DRAFT_302383 [Flammula alnicola]|nr:hypothetical protein BDZ97DRAFT_302383 [Flammula alnicola]
MHRNFFSSYLDTGLRPFSRMLSRLVDIPASVFPTGGVKWALSWIVLLSVAYTYFINRLSQDSVMRSGTLYSDPHKKKQYFARIKRLQAAQRDLVEKQRQIVERGSFRLLDLPPEISLVVLAHCADWPSTYLALVRVSERCQGLTFNACLPRMPVRLITPEQIRSFDCFLRARPKLASLVHYMWVTPLKEDLLGTSVGIVKKCSNLRSLASNAYIVQESITFRGTQLSHVDCKDLTLLSTRTQAWTSLLSTSNGAAFFRQLTHLRLIGDRVPSNIPLPNLTHLSYGTSGRDLSENDASIGLLMLDDQEAYPSLHTVIVTKPRSAGGLRISRPVAKKRLFIFELPLKNTELEIWCDNASQRGMWELCADPPPHPNTSSPRRGRRTNT